MQEPVVLLTAIALASHVSSTGAWGLAWPSGPPGVEVWVLFRWNRRLLLFRAHEGWRSGLRGVEGWVLSRWIGAGLVSASEVSG